MGPLLPVLLPPLGMCSWVNWISRTRSCLSIFGIMLIVNVLEIRDQLYFFFFDK